MEVTVITSKHRHKTFLTMYRKDGLRMNYAQIQSHKKAVLVDIECLMLFPMDQDEVDKANVYHLLHDPDYIFEPKLQEIDDIISEYIEYYTVKKEKVVFLEKIK